MTLPPETPDLGFIRRRQPAGAPSGQSASAVTAPAAGPSLDLSSPGTDSPARAAAPRGTPVPQQGGSPSLDLTRPPRRGPEQTQSAPSLDMSHPNRPQSPPQRQAPAQQAPSLDLSRPAPRQNPTQRQTPVQQAPSLDLSHPAPPQSRPQRQAPARPAPSLDLSGPARASSGPAAAGGGPTPGQPQLDFLRRRPARRDSADIQRTGNPAVDFSSGPVSGPAAGLRVHHDVPTLRGRTVLDRRSPKVLIGGEQAGSGSMHFTLRWSTTPPDPRAAAAGLRRSTDLHLGCLWEMNDRTTGVIQTFDRGSEAAVCEGSTVLRLGGRSETDGQTLVASIKHLALLRRMVLFAYAYNGRPEWHPLSMSMSVTLRGGVVIDLRPDIGPNWATVCALASLHRVGNTLVLRLEQEYLNGQQQTVAEAYGFELPWVGGRSVPPPRLR